MYSIANYLTYSNYLVFVIVFFLLIYYVFNESKKIGIMKIHGTSSLLVWFLLIGRLILILFIFSTLILLLAALCVKDTLPQFIGSTIINQFKLYSVLLSLSLAAYLYISCIKVSNALKNRRDTDGILALNSLFKLICSGLLILACIVVWNQYRTIKTEQENLRHWEHSKDYGVFYPVIAGKEEVENGGMLNTINDELYTYLNRRGALLINAYLYEEDMIKINQGYRGFWSISVNPNYLREYPIFDSQQQPIQISEDCSEWILLVPEKYKSQEKEILSFFKEDRSGGIKIEGKYNFEERNFKRTVPDRIRNQEIKIIYLANQQKIFSFNPEVYPSNNNVIEDPIIQVVTEQNSLLMDRDGILGAGPGDPLKIKLLNRDAVETYQSILPNLNKWHLGNHLPYLVSSNQLMIEKIYTLQATQVRLEVVALGLLICLLFLVVQNSIIFFTKYQYRFIVRRLFGAGFFRTYMEYLRLLCVFWALQAVIVFAVHLRMNIGTLVQLVLIIAGLIVIELAVSIVALVFIERRNRIRILKEGI